MEKAYAVARPLQRMVRQGRCTPLKQDGEIVLRFFTVHCAETFLGHPYHRHRERMRITVSSQDANICSAWARSPSMPISWNMAMASVR